MSALARPPSNPAWERRVTEGAMVAGAYRVRHIVGEGSSGEVWAATDTTSGAAVALKVLAPTASQDRELAQRFRREAYFLARTASDHVARIHDFVCDPELGMVLVMELVEGESLATLLNRGSLSVDDTLALGIGLLDGVHVLHTARVIHRDLKPGNVMMRPGPDGRPRPVICDFGLSRLARRRPDDSASGASMTALTKGDVAMGTVRYMAPEQVLNARQVTEQSDLYSVAAILHRAVSGRPPFGEIEAAGEVARAKVIGEAPPLDLGRADAASRGLERVIMRALRRRPAERHPDAAAMRAELVSIAEAARVASADGETVRIPSPASVSPPLSRGVPVRSTLAVAAALLLVYGAGVVTGRALSRGPAIEGTAAATIALPDRPAEAPAAAPRPLLEPPLVLSAAPAPSPPVASSPAEADDVPVASVRPPPAASRPPALRPPPRPRPRETVLDDNPY